MGLFYFALFSSAVKRCSQTPSIVMNTTEGKMNNIHTEAPQTDDSFQYRFSLGTFVSTVFARLKTTPHTCVCVVVGSLGPFCCKCWQTVKLLPKSSLINYPYMPMGWMKGQYEDCLFMKRRFCFDLFERNDVVEKLE